jgi:excinuclease ABC subunit A
MYVLDEPSIGLHQRDNNRLLGTLKHLRDLGNSVLVVEHDEEAINIADYVIDMGPGAGEHGGHIVAEGTPRDILASEASLTGQYLSGSAASRSRRCATSRSRKRVLKVVGATGNNLKNVTLDVPGRAVHLRDGRIGSGKSTLINDTLYHAVARHLYGSSAEPAPHDEIDGARAFRQGDQRRPEPDRPHAAVESRDVHRASSRRSASCSRRSRNRASAATVPDGSRSTSRAGRCEACQGDGLIKVEMHFLPDVYVPCDVCHAQRYYRETLEVQYKGKNIHHVLSMTVEQAYAFFEPVPGRRQEAADAARRGALATSRSAVGDDAVGRRGAAGEARAGAVEARYRPHAVHPRRADDGPALPRHRLLLTVLHRLRDHGNTVVVIEHNLDVIKTADWIVDLARGWRRRRADHRRRLAGDGRREQVQLHRPLPARCARAAVAPAPQGA